MLLTRYAPFRRSPSPIAGYAAPRLACVKPPASVHPEPGSNSSLYIFYNVCSSCYSFLFSFFEINALLFILLLKLYFFFQYVNELFLFPPSLPKGAAKIERILELQKIFQGF